MSDPDWWFLDLAVVIAVSGTLAFGLFAGVEGPLRIAFALPFVCFLPGYALMAALFPDETGDDYRSFDDEKMGLRNPLLLARGLEPIERFVLSVVFSVAIVPAATLITAATPRGLTAETVLSAIAVLTVALAVLAIVSRARCPPQRRYSPTLSDVTPFFAGLRPNAYGVPTPRPYNVAIALALTLLLASVGFALAAPPQHDGFTEFSIETEDVTGETKTMYESTYAQGETGEVAVSITNHEREETTYTTVAVLERVDGDGVVTDRTELTRESTTVADGETREQPLEFTPTQRGEDLRLTLLLFESEPPAEPTGDDAYRVVSVPIEVR
ncbi:DUF1616 domain-containing protein [Natrarchaeobius chitinivorans]|uniref:DUF1616 domain-containing protein n=1 Tax=Natrarchaeobius chitinivorans TaxID=1679083 RepID=A0A3N6LXA8_NATCH|nr:DUF1616 domain-containing protein [Natrarchaeobius chitinivorans]RQG95383.1 DUF1616 domain-containing protein [Natrarchaeobius chitinivorans]